MKKRLSKAVFAGMFLLILTVISWKICGINTEDNREGAIVFEQTEGSDQHKDTEEMIELQEATENFIEATENSVEATESFIEATEEYIIGEKAEEEYRVYDQWHDIIEEESM